MSLRAAVLEILYTANTQDVERGEKEVKASAERIEKKPIKKKIDVDSKSALADMDKVEGEAKKLVSNKTALKLDADISRAEKSLERAKQRLEDLEVRALGGLDVTADTKRAQAALSRVERNLDALTKAREVIEVDASTVLADAALEGLKDRAEGAGADAGDQAGAALGENIVAAIASIPIAGALVMLGKAAGDAIVEGVQDGLQQEVGRDRLEALTGIDEESAARLARIAGEAYANVYGESVEANMNTARLALQFDLIDADSAQRDSQRVIQGLAGIADVLGEDVQPVARAVTQLLRTGLARSAQEAFDIIAAGEREGVNVAGDLLDTINEYSTQFRKLGIDGPQAMGLLSQAIRAGARDSDIAADAIKEFGVFATDPAYREAFNDIGFSWDDLNRRISEGGPEAASALDEVLDRLRAMPDESERNAAAITLFGTKAEDMSDALLAMDLSSAVAQMNGVEGAAQRMFDTLADNDATTIEQARRNIEVAADGIKGALAGAFSEPLANAAEWVSENRGPMLQFFQDLVNSAIDFGHSMVDSAADGTEAFGEFVAGPLAELVEGMAGVIDVFNGNEGRPQELDDMAASMRGFRDTSSEAAERIRGLHDNLDEARGTFNGFMDEQVAMGYLNDATLRVADAVSLVGLNAEGAIMGLDGIDRAQLNASESGLALEGQIRRALLALDEEVNAAARAGEGQDELAARYRASRDALAEQLVQMGMTRGEADALIETVLRTPSTANTRYDSNAVAERGRVQDLAHRIQTLPDGSVVITADTSQAAGAMQRFITAYDGTRIRTYVDAYGGTSYRREGSTVSFQHDGAVLEFMAAGGLRGLTPMAPVAQMVPQNTWRVVGDRSDVAEAYIPLDGSARSMAILLEVMRRSGLMPMGQGGVVERAAASARATGLDFPVVLDGRLVGWLRDLATEQARFVLASDVMAAVRGRRRGGRG